MKFKLQISIVPSKTQTRCEYIHVRSTTYLTAMDGGNAGNAGAITGHDADGLLFCMRTLLTI